MKERWREVGFVLILLVASGCSAERYRESADREVKGIIAAKQKLVLGQERSFDLSRTAIPLTEIGTPGEVEDLRRTPSPKPIIQPLVIEEDEVQAHPEPSPEAKAPPAAPGEPKAPPREAQPPQGPQEAQPPQGAAPPPGAPPAKEEEQKPEIPLLPARILTLEETLRVAFVNNRNYQTQKEALYLNALTLTLFRWQFAPRFFGIITGEYTDNQNQSGERTGSVSTSFGWNQVLASGARLSLSIANNFFMFFSGEQRRVASTLVSGTLTQPLLRGFGKKIVEEPLTQAERNVIYQVRTFERYRQIFMVQVSSEYYRVIQARQRVSNEYVNWQSLVNNLDRAQALTEGEKLPKFEVDQVRQQELQAQDRYVSAVEDYQSALDRFKVTLNIPVDAVIGLDQKELARLENLTALQIQFNVADAIATGLRRRLDVQNVRDRAEDSVRKAGVAADGLRAQLDLQLTAGIPSSPGSNKPFQFNAQDIYFGAGFDLNLPFDRRAERNEYVSALIEVEAQKRDVSLAEDEVQLAVRESLRRFLREQKTYEIQAASVQLARARVDSTNALRDAGRADTRDVLESQSALIDAENALTTSLINLAIARLQFASETGTLRVLESGRYEVEPIRSEEPPVAAGGMERAKPSTTSRIVPGEPPGERNSNNG